MGGRRKICVVTGTRAEYGQLTLILDLIRRHPALKLQLIVCGMHLEPEYGLTYREIEADGFRIDRKVAMELNSATPAGVTRSTGLGMIGFADAFAELRPDVVLVLGDRFEIFAAAAAALLGGFPLAHISGGEKTEGAFDDSLRHAITKMAQIHFPAAEEYRRRVEQLGEPPETVFCVGDPAVDVMLTVSLLSREEIEKELGIRFLRRNLLITFHPVTLDGEATVGQFARLLEVLDEQPETMLIFTRPNADCYGREITALLDAFAAARPERVAVFTSLGQRRYLSLLKLADAVVGNSSSGIVETPTFKTPSINVGDRQKGRLRSISVIDCEPEAKSIRQAFTTLYSPEFQAALPLAVNPYGDGGASAKIVDTLAGYDLDRCRRKVFYDLPG